MSVIDTSLEALSSMGVNLRRSMLARTDDSYDRSRLARMTLDHIRAFERDLKATLAGAPGDVRALGQRITRDHEELEALAEALRLATARSTLHPEDASALDEAATLRKRLWLECADHAVREHSGASQLLSER